MRTQRTLLCALALAVVSLLAAGSVEATVRLGRMVVVGDSVLAGFSSGGFIARGHGGQVDSAPAFVARRAGVSLLQPLMSAPGVPAQLNTVDANGNGQVDPGEGQRTDSWIGSRGAPTLLGGNLEPH